MSLESLLYRVSPPELSRADLGFGWVSNMIRSRQEIVRTMMQDVDRIRPWWENGVLYHIYLRSFVDSNGDGFGDLKGAMGKIDYLADLGVDGVWLSPTMPSPNDDWGYDVADYLGVHPDYGTIDDLDEFIERCSEKGVRVLLDLVPNHTSSSHPWFIKALEEPESPFRRYYVFAKGKPDGSPPNNWKDATGASAWTLDERSGEYYLHNFLPSQPDLNWWNEDVQREFEHILRFWFDRGVAGFRIDVAHGIFKDKLLRDDPPAPEMSRQFSHFGLVETYSKNRDEVHPLYKRWRKIADAYRPNRLLVGETWVGDIGRLARFYGDGDELNLAFNFMFVFTEFDPKSLSEIVQSTLLVLPDTASPVWTGSNHDISRFPTRWAHDDDDKTKVALTILLTLPGTVFLYYGDEIGMRDVDVPIELQRDPMTKLIPMARFQRDRARTPMPWRSGDGRGFCDPGTTPWLPFGPDDGRDVQSQSLDESSALTLTKRLIRLRGSVRDTLARFESLEVTEKLWRYRCGDLYVVANFAEDESYEASLPPYKEAVSSRYGAVGSLGDSDLFEVGPKEAVVFRR